MSRNALALVDCNDRDILFQFLVENFDKKAAKNEMISPYDDQLIGKMNFRYREMDHAMFFTYARSSEYPGMRFQNHKIIYLSLGVNDISSAIFQQICDRFGGFIDYDDDREDGWQKVECIKQDEEEVDISVGLLENGEEIDAFDEENESFQILKVELKENIDENMIKENRRKENRSNSRRNNHHSGINLQKQVSSTERGEKKDGHEDSRRRQRNHHRGHVRGRGDNNTQKMEVGEIQKEPEIMQKQEKTAGSESQA